MSVRSMSAFAHMCAMHLCVQDHLCMHTYERLELSRGNPELGCTLHPGWVLLEHIPCRADISTTLPPDQGPNGGGTSEAEKLSSQILRSLRKSHIHGHRTGPGSTILPCPLTGHPEALRTEVPDRSRDTQILTGFPEVALEATWACKAIGQGTDVSIFCRCFL